MSAADVANVAVLWVTSIGLGYLMQILGIPPLLGSLIAGIILQNASSDFEVSPRFGEFVETLGLCVILLISSTEIDMHSVASCGGVSAPQRQLPGQHLGAAGADGGLRFIYWCPHSVVLLFEGIGYR